MINQNISTSLFPNFIDFYIKEELSEKINSIVEQYKSNIKKAVVYSVYDDKNIESENRLSLKTSFDNNDITYLIYEHLIPIINNMLKDKFPNNLYYIQIGEQLYDYIVYKNGGYFETHQDFIRINSDTQAQYTMLIGLSNYWTGNGSTIIWIPFINTTNTDTNTTNLIELEAYNDELKTDYDYIINLNIDTVEELQYEQLNKIMNKYFDSNYYTIDIIQFRNLLLSNPNHMPYFFNSYEKTKVLLFKSNLPHSGEKYYSDSISDCIHKELLSITLNITACENYKNQQLDKQLDKQSDQIKQNYFNIIPEKYLPKVTDWLLSKINNKIIVFDKFELWQIEFARTFKLVPFQIILNDGKYNGNQFNNKYTKYLNLDNDLKKIYNIVGTSSNHDEHHSVQNDNLDDELDDQYYEQYDNYYNDYDYYDCYTYDDYDKKYNEYFFPQSDISQSDISQSDILQCISKTLLDIYKKTKYDLSNLANKRYDEVYSSIEEINSNMSNISQLFGLKFDTSYLKTIDLNVLNKIKTIVDDYVKNYQGHNNVFIKHKELVDNRWSREMCNDDNGSSGHYTSYLNCNIDIKFCFISIE